MGEGNPGIAIFITALLIAVNGALASAELALMGLNEGKLKEQAKEGDKKSALLLRMKQNPSDFLSTLQIGITLASLLSGAFAADTLAKPIIGWLGTLGISGGLLSVLSAAATFFITLIMTYFMLVFGELVPKRMAMAKPEKTARGTIKAINALSKVVKPLVRLLAASTNAVLRLLGIDKDHKGAPITEGEILLMMQEAREGGEVEESEIAFMSNVFEFTDTRAEEAMTHRTDIEALPLQATLDDAVRMITETGFNKIPVYKDGSIDRIVGVLHARDLVKHYLQRDASITVEALMRKPYFVYEAYPLNNVFTEMKHSKNHLAVVVDEYGGTSGIITMMDIIEELVGDIEEDGVSDDIIAMEDGSYLIAGSAELDDVRRELQLPEFSDADIETMSGLVIQLLGYVPSAEEHPRVTYGGYAFTVEQMDGVLVRFARARRDDKISK